MKFIPSNAFKFTFFMWISNDVAAGYQLFSTSEIFRLNLGNFNETKLKRMSELY